MALITFTNKGLYCPLANLYIDPWRPVQNAIITHGHSDHACAGSTNYLCHTKTAPILNLRLGKHNYKTMPWGQSITINGVKISMHPAGHIIGSSQIRLEHNGEVWVFSGDYKTENDGISGAFEPITCHNFITESTFGLPIYNWLPQAAIYNQIQQWVLQCFANNKNAIIIAYSLGKAQRVIEAVAAITQNIYAHGAVYNMQQTLIEAGEKLQPVNKITLQETKSQLKNAVIIAPPGAEGTTWLKKLMPYSLAICSGWMQVRGNARRRNADQAFVLSDHADWTGLLQAVKATQAQNIYVTHGFTASFSKYLNELGLHAQEIKTNYGTDEDATQQNAVVNNIEQQAIQPI
jgi:putative mRNA 3-end processing factor